MSVVCAAVRRLGLLATALVLAAAQPAAAHSALQATEPPADQLTSGSVDRLTLTFAQHVDVLDDSVTVTAPDGQQVEVSDTARMDDGVTVVAALAARLPSGTHTVAWRVIGADGHPIEGSYRITVADAGPDPTATALPAAARTSAAADDTSGDVGGGDAAMSPSAAAPVPKGGDVAEAVQTAARWIVFMGIMMVIGVAVFGIAVHPDSPADQAMLTTLVTGGSALVLVGSVVQLLAHVAVIGGSGSDSLLDPSAWRVVAGSGVFFGTVVRAGAAVLVIRTTQAFPEWSHEPRQALGPIVGAAALLLSFQFTGHTATSQPSLFVRAANATHVLAAAVWTGGVVALAGVVSARRRRGSANDVIVGRFSVVATGSVVVVGVAGAGLAAVELGSFIPLVTTSYGRVLLGKLAVVAAIGAVGAYNHTRLVPAIVDGDPDAVARMQRTMRLELALVPVALVLTAYLVSLSP